MRTILRQLRQLLGPDDRSRVFRLTAAVLTSNVLETLSIAALLPFMIVVTQPESAFSGPIGSLYHLVGEPERSRFLVVLGGGLLSLVMIANATATATIFRLARFAWGMNDELSRRMLLRYVRQPYAFFLGRNATELSKNVLTEVEKAVIGVVIPIVFGLARGGFGIMVIIMLAMVDTLAAVVAALLVGCGYTAIYLVVRGRLKRYGEERLDANATRFRLASEALSGIKAVKILGREETFIRRYSVPSLIYARTTANREFLTLAPRYALEAVAFGGMIGLVMLVLIRPGGPEGVLPTLALFGFGGVKLMPAMQQVFSSFASVRFYAPSLDMVHTELVGDGSVHAEEPTGSMPAVEGAPIVGLEGVTYSYPASEVPAVHDVSIEIRQGRLHGFVGRTGSGKTTTMDLVLGLLTPDRGRVLIEGHPLSAVGTTGWRRRIGYVPQEIYLTDDTIANNIAFGVRSDELDMDRVREASRIALVDEVVEALSDGFDTLVGDRGLRLSGGQRQRIGIARALYTEPELLVLDEGTSALDPSTEAEIIENLRSLGTTVLWVTHRLATVEHFDTIFVFGEGTVVASGSHEALLESSGEYRSQVAAAPRT